MAGGSRQLKKLNLSETGPCAMGGSDGSNSVTPPASDGDRTSMSSPILQAQGESTMEREKSGECSGSTRSAEEQMEQCRALWSVLAERASIPEDEQESDYVTAAAVPAAESDDATESKFPFMTAVDEEIERSRAHWSTLADQSGSVEGEEVAEVSNVEAFLALQSHPSWGTFFQTFGYELDDSEYLRMGELELGEKFAEGGQAELYNAHVTWWKPESDLRLGMKYVVKVFKKGTFLKHLQSQLPQGLLQQHAEGMENMKSPTPEVFPRYFCNVELGLLLEDGRFAFLMVKEHFDLRNLIERHMESRSGKDCGPFSKEEAELIMYHVVLGVNWLHSRGIIHRDLKASNVLVQEFRGTWPKWECYVADYECSVGVIGTGFFRAPEILEACKDKMASKKLEVFSTAADAYSFGMTCYEILTGKLPFEDHPLGVSTLTDLVINQHLRPEVPEHVENWARELLTMCWQFDPIARPLFSEILDLLSTHSTIVRRYEDWLISDYGQNCRNWRYNRIPNS